MHIGEVESNGVRGIVYVHMHYIKRLPGLILLINLSPNINCAAADVPCFFKLVHIMKMHISPQLLVGDMVYLFGAFVVIYVILVYRQPLWLYFQKRIAALVLRKVADEEEVLLGLIDIVPEPDLVDHGHYGEV